MQRGVFCVKIVERGGLIMGNVMTIGIAGGTGSGKTTITRRLQQRFADSVSVIYHDNYYKAHNDMTYEERSKLNLSLIHI